MVHLRDIWSERKWSQLDDDGGLEFLKSGYVLGVYSRAEVSGEGVRNDEGERYERQVPQAFETGAFWDGSVLKTYLIWCRRCIKKENCCEREKCFYSLS